MSDEILWIFHRRDGAYINGVPARDLTATDLVRLSEDQLVAVETSGLYRRPAPQKQEKGAPSLDTAAPVFEPHLADGAQQEPAEEIAPKKSKGLKE